MALASGIFSLAAPLSAQPILEAAASGDREGLSSALAAGAALDTRDAKGWTPLIHAIDAGQTTAASWLIAKGADVNASSALGYSPLAFAAGCGNPIIVRELIQRGARLDAADPKFGVTPFQMAIRGSSEKVVRLFIEHGVDVNAPQDKEGNTPLLLAANRGLTSIVEILLEAGAKIDGASPPGIAPLMAAASRNQLKTAKYLLAKGANAKLADEGGQTALDWAESSERFRNQYEEMKELLYTAMTGKSRRSLIDDFSRAIRTGDNRTVIQIAENPAIFADNKGEGVLIAAASRNTEAARYLIEHGARHGQINGAGFTPLLYAAITGNTDLARLLLEHDAEVNTANREGLTPLMAAARTGAFALVKLLLEKGAEISAQDNQGRTALDLAQAQGNKDIIALLHAAGPVVQTARLANSLVKPLPPPNEVKSGTIAHPTKVNQTIALIPFVSADGSYISSEAAANMASLLTTDPILKDRRWVEREELDKARSELGLSLMTSADAGDALRLGKWLGAEFIVTGRFGIDSGDGRELLVEVIDVHRADVLAWFRYLVKGPLGSPLQIEKNDTDEIARLLAAALSAAAKTKDRTDNPVVFAPLFFRNISSTGDRADFLEEEILAAFQQSEKAGSHILRFPGITKASEERDLAIVGLVDKDHAAWQKVADVYVWGSFEEIGATDLPFGEVTIRMSLTTWDGIGATKTESREFRLNDAPAALSSWIGEVTAAGTKRSSPSTVTVEKIARRALLERAKELQRQEQNTQGSGNISSAWQRRLELQTRLLQLAYFFAPTDPEINRQLLIAQWAINSPKENVRGRPVASRFESLWKRSQAWGAYVDRFGLASLDQISTDPATTEKLPRPPATEQAKEFPYPAIYGIMPWVVAREIEYSDYSNGFPEGVPAAVSREWQKRVQMEFLRRLRQLAAEKPERFNLRMSQFFPVEKSSDILIADPVLRAEIYATIWKLGAGENMSEENRRRFRATVQVSLASVSREAQTDQLLATGSGPQIGYPGFALSTNDQNEKDRQMAEREKALQNQKTLAPGEISVAFQAIKLTPQEDVNSIDSSILIGDELWAVIQFAGAPNAIWKGGTDTQDVTGSQVLTAPVRFTSLVKSGNDFWIGTDGAGVWRYDTTANVLTKFDSRSGLPSGHMQAGALSQGRLFFGGGNYGEGRIGSFDFATQSWTTLGPVGGSDAEPRAQVRKLAATTDWLLVFSINPQGGNTEKYDLLNLNTRSWSSLDVPALESKHFMPAIVSDASGFWIGGASTILRVTPLPHGGITLEPCDIPLEGEVSALADDGLHLWIATSVISRKTADFSECTTRLYRMDKAKGKWDIYARVPYNAPISSISVDTDTLWLGLDTRYESPAYLLRAPKAAFDPGQETLTK